MDSKILLIFLAFGILPYCTAVTIYVMKAPAEINAVQSLRKFYDFHPGKTSGSKILGVPTKPSHLPEAEPILPGHTLIRPGFSMLKSAIKFPHKDLEDGAGVYGNIDNLGITYDHKSERVLYTGFRRSDLDSLPKGARVIVLLSNGNKKVEEISDNALPRKEVDSPKKTWYIEKIYPAFFRNAKLKENEKGQKKNGLNYDLESKTLGNHPSFSLRRLIELTTPKDNASDMSMTESNKSVQKEPVELNDSKNDESKDTMSSDLDVSDNDAIESEPVYTKSEWFWSMKDAYNHIKISHEAPTLSELRPLTPEPPTLPYWHFNQDDMYSQLQ